MEIDSKWKWACLHTEMKGLVLFFSNIFAFNFIFVCSLGMQSYVLILQFLQTFIFKEGSEVFSWEKKDF